MFRKTLIAAAVVMAPMGVSMADNDIGCGVGTILWEGQSGVPAKVLAATTNGTFGNQTFGITSGTLNCQQGGVITASARLPMYASANLDRIAADMAAGHGETLNNLAALYGIAESDRDAFNHTARANFAKIFTSEKTTAGEMLGNLEGVMADDAKLARYLG